MNRVLLALAVLLIVFGAAAQTTNGLSKAEIEGRQLAKRLCEARPSGNYTNSGIVQTTWKSGTRTNISITFRTFVDSNSWGTICDINGVIGWISIIHKDNQPTIYYNNGQNDVIQTPMSESEINSNFVGDFSLADLGLEFFHWPDQKILRHEDKRTRACAVLESTNPNPGPSAYSRVDLWIDNETLGLIHAEAYDASGKLLKVFDPKSFKKVNGQWELQDMEIHNVQTKSRTSIKFDLK
jgi:outer membrane lipoprotein-sorting protein